MNNKFFTTPAAIAAYILVISLFLPWVGFFGMKINGMDLIKNSLKFHDLTSTLFILVPLGVVGFLVMGAMGKEGMPMNVCMMLPMVYFVYFLIRRISEAGMEMFKLFEIGMWIAMLASFAMGFFGGQALRKKQNA